MLVKQPKIQKSMSLITTCELYIEACLILFVCEDRNVFYGGNCRVCALLIRAASDLLGALDEI